MKKITVILIIILLFNFILFPPVTAPVYAEDSLLSRENITGIVKGFAAMYLLDRVQSSFFEETENSVEIEDISENQTEKKNVATSSLMDRAKMEDQEQEAVTGISSGDRSSIGSDILKGRVSRTDVLNGKTIVIDPGHGGYDSGAIGPGGLLEKDVVLDISLKLFRILQEKSGARVYLTRNDDSFISLSHRGAMTNSLDADIFLSIHSNADYQGRKSGIETYAHYNASEKTWARAWYIHESLVEYLGLPDRGLQADNFQVLRETPGIESILLEIGYISNTDDETFLRKDGNKQLAAEAIFEGLINYYSGG